MGKSTNIDAATIQRVASGESGFARIGSRTIAPAGWFSPLKPTAPVAQVQAVGRQFDYQTGQNLRNTVKSDAAVTYPELRALADNLDVLRLVIETRKDQVEAFDWSIKAKEDKTVPDAALDAARDFFQNPTPEYNWSSWLRMILEELFVIDAVAIYPRMTRGGDLFSLDLIDGATIKRVIDDGGRTPIAPEPAYQQILHGVQAVNYTSDELIYLMRNPRVSKLYGFSPVEQIVMTINVALRRQITQLQYFTEGNIPEALAGVPDTWNPDQIKQFQMYFDSIMQGNTAARSRLKFLPLDTNNIHETRQPDLKSQFDEWLARVVCYAFSVSSAPFVAQMNRATAQTAQEAAQSEGLSPTLAFIKRMMDKILETKFGLKDAEFVWEIKSATKPLEQAQIDQIYLTAGVKDVDEIREGLGLEAKEIVPPAHAQALQLAGIQGKQQADAKASADAAAATAAKAANDATAEPVKPVIAASKIDSVIAEMVKAATAALSQP